MCFFKPLGRGVLCSEPGWNVEYLLKYTMLSEFSIVKNEVPGVPQLRCFCLQDVQWELPGPWRPHKTLWGHPWNEDESPSQIAQVRFKIYQANHDMVTTQYFYCCFYCHIFCHYKKQKKVKVKRAAATKSWPWLLGFHFFTFGPIELIFQYVGANVC